MQNFCITLLGGSHMKTLRQMCGGMILTVALTVSVLAGEIDCPGYVPPPPPPTGTSSGITTTVILALVRLIR